MKPVVVTASLTTGTARVAHGIAASVRLVDDILSLDHAEWETTLAVGDVEFHSTRNGPYPNHQMRVSVRPSSGIAALHYTDHDNPGPMVLSHNPNHPLPDVGLIFNGTTGAVFPGSAQILIPDVRNALIQWLQTRQRPTCIEWRPHDLY